MITLRDMCKKHHWQVAGHTFDQLHLLFDAHADELAELIDQIPERVQVRWVVRQEMHFNPTMDPPDVRGDHLVQVVNRLLAM